MLTYYAIRAALRITPRLSRAAWYRLASVVGLTFYSLNRPARRAITANLRIVMGEQTPRRDLRQAVRSVFVNMVKDYYDLVQLASAENSPADRVEARGMEHIDEALSRGKGIIAVFCHLAGFNLACGTTLVSKYGPISIVAEPLQPLRLREQVNSLRSSGGLSVIEADSGSTRKILRRLRAGEVVALAADRGVTGTGVSVPFFGREALLPGGAAALSLRSGAQVLVVLSGRLPDNRVSLQVLPAPTYTRTRDFDADVARLIRGWMAVFEEHIRAHPGQWLLAQPLWGADGP